MRLETSPRPAAVVLCAAFLALDVAAQSVWNVAPTPGPGIDFTSVPAAVAGTQDGDLLLLAPGTYPVSGMWILGRALRIRGAGQGVTVLQGDLGIVPPSPPLAFDLERVTVNGNTLFQSGAAPTSGLTTFADVTFNGAVRSSLFDSFPNQQTGFRFALHRCVVNGVVDCSGELILSDCTVTAPPGPPNPGFGAPPPGPDAVRIIGTAAIYRSSLTGGTASPAYGPWQVPSQCGRGLFVKGAGSTAVVSGSGSSTIAGGSGAYWNQYPPFNWPGGALPGPGIAADAGATATTHPGVAVVGGTNTNTGGGAVPTVGSVTASTTHLPTLTVGPWTTTVAASIAVSFAPGAAAGFRPYVVAAALGQDVFPLGPGYVGPFLLDGFTVVLRSGFLDASGAASFTISTPYTAQFLYLPVYAQVAAFDPNLGAFALGQTTTFQLVP